MLVVTLVVACLVELAARATGLGVGLRPMSDALEVLATALFFGAAALRYTSWRVTGAACQGAGSAALVVFAGATFPVTLVVRTVGGASGPTALASLARLVAAGVVAVILAPALRRHRVDSRLRPWGLAVSGLLVAVVAFTVGTAAVESMGPGVRTSVGLRSGLDLSAALVWWGLAALWLRAAVRRREPAAVWSAVATGLIGAAGLVRAVTSDRELWSWLVAVGVLMLAAAAVSASNAVAEARTVLSDEGRALVATSGALADAENLLVAVETRREELVHDARSMISTLRAASLTLDRHAEDLDGASAHRLRAAMDVELDRLGRLIDGSRLGSREDFAVAEALEPVVTTLRARGLDVACDLGDLRALASQDDVAEAVRNLLVNAQVHAPGSPVEVHGRVDGTRVLVYVDDRGPGVPAGSRLAVLERGTSLGTGPGSGLGLHVARRLLRDQGGDLEVRDRPGGGARFVVSLPCGERRAASTGEGRAVPVGHGAFGMGRKPVTAVSLLARLGDGTQEARGRARRAPQVLDV